MGTVSPSYVLSAISLVFPQATCIIFAANSTTLHLVAELTYSELIGGAGNGNFLLTSVGRFAFVQVVSAETSSWYHHLCAGFRLSEIVRLYLYFPLVSEVTSQCYLLVQRNKTWWFQLMARVLFCVLVRCVSEQRILLKKEKICNCEVTRNPT